MHILGIHSYQWVLLTGQVQTQIYILLQQGVKSVQIRSFFWSVFSCIRTRKSSVFGHSLRSANPTKRTPECLLGLQLP